jgi:hypothetical protein
VTVLASSGPIVELVVIVVALALIAILVRSA